MENIKKSLLALALVAASLSSASASAATNSLGLSSSLNLLAFGNMNVMSSDVQGTVAVGGNATINGYSINSPAFYPGNALTVAGDLTYTGGSIYGNTVVGGNLTSNYSGSFNGSVAVGGNLNASSGISATGVTVWGTTTGYQPWYPAKAQGTGSFSLGMDFTAERARLTSLSTELSSDAVTGTATNSFSTLVFNATNSNGINIFDITASQAGMNMQINGLGASGTVIINVSGSNVSFGSHGYTNFGSGNQVLFNLAEATTVSVGSLYGSLLAPNATVLAGYGHIEGQVVVNNWTTSVQVNNVPFVGSLPVTAVPEPETYAMFLAGLGIMGVVARRRKQK